MKVVVTGATGHIGNVLVRDLIDRGYEVTSMVLNEKDKEVLKDLNTKLVYGDVRKIETLVKAFENAEIVFHLAGIIEIGSGNKKNVRAVNVEGSKNVVAACKMAHVKKLVYTSSVHAIPEKEGIISEITEFSPKLVKGTYAKSKAEATNYILKSNSQDLEVIIVHPSGVIGPYEYIKSNMGQLIIDCANGRMKATLKGGYNFVDVRDVSKGIILAAEKGKPGECYILAGYSITIQELMAIIEKLTGKKAPKFVIARWFAFITGALSEIYYKIVHEKPLFTSYAVYTTGTNHNFSIEKAKKELGYTVRNIENTIQDTIEWYKKRGEIK
mgnify:FL=1